MAKSATRPPRRMMHRFALFGVFRRGDVAMRRWGAVCEGDGHVIAKWMGPLEWMLLPPGIVHDEYPNFCHLDGSRVIHTCRSCGSQLACTVQRSGWSAEPFCWSCGEPHPWATREQRVRKLYALLEAESLSEEEHLIVLDQLAILSEPPDQTTHEDQVHAGRRIKTIAPKLWESLLPVLQSLLTAEAKRRLGLQ
jgi:hypothetical protein